MEVMVAVTSTLCSEGGIKGTLREHWAFCLEGQVAGIWLIKEDTGSKFEAKAAPVTIQRTEFMSSVGKMTHLSRSCPVSHVYAHRWPSPVLTRSQWLRKQATFPFCRTG